MNPPSTSDLERADQAAQEAAIRFTRADYPAAETLYQTALAGYASSPGASAIQAARCRLGLGQVRNTQARFTEARELVEAALQNLRDDPLLAAAARYTLGEIYANLGDLSRGMEHLMRACELRLEALGETAPDTLDSLSLLAVFYYARGEKDSARRLIEETVKAARQYSGEPHPAVGKVFQRQGRILMDDPAAEAAADTALHHALAIFEQTEGPDHPDAGLALNNLAYLRSNQKRWGEARDLLLHSLAIHKRAYGPQSVFTMFVLGNLADIEKRLDNLEAAYHYAARALIAAVRGLGAQSPQALAALRRVVSLLGLRSRAGDENAVQVAMPFHVCLVSLEGTAGKAQPGFQPGAHLPSEQAARRLEGLVDRLEAEIDHPPRTTDEQAAEQMALTTARELAEQADHALGTGDAQRAHALYQQALAAQEAIYGPNHLAHLPLLDKLAETSKPIGRPSAVLALRGRSVAINTAILGEDHPQTLMAMTRLSLTLAYEYGETAARPLRQRIQELMARSLGDTDPLASSMREQLKRMQAMAQSSAPRQGPSRSERVEAALGSFNDPAGVLAGLDQVDWNSVQHAYGPAWDIPRYLKMLLSADETVRAAAWEDLINSIWHQGSLYEATAATVPFLMRFLDDPAYPDRGAVMDTLAGLADSSAYLSVYSRPGVLLIDPVEMLEWLNRQKGAARRLEEVADQINRAVALGLPRYRALLDDPDLEMQTLALLALSRLRDRQAETVPAVLAWLEKASDPGRRAAALCALRALLYAGAKMPDGSTPAAFFARQLASAGADPRLIFQAAAGVIEREGAASPAETVDALISAWSEACRQAEAERGQVRSLFGEFPRVFASDLQVLACLGAERGGQALARALPLAQPPQGSSQDVFTLAAAMLDLLFNAGQELRKSVAHKTETIAGAKVRRIEYQSTDRQPARSPQDLTGSQRAALESLLALPAFWETRHNLLALYGLPETQEELRRFLAEG